jgi:N-acetylglutamate synthase-like GNAT family acetyltransferase
LSEGVRYSSRRAAERRDAVGHSVIEIRRILPTDPLYPQECALREEVLLRPIGYDIGRFRSEFGVEDRFEHFVAVFDHPGGPRVVGTACLLPDYPTPGVGKLMQMAVDLQRQGEGIGRRLVVAIEQRAFGQLRLTELFCHARDTAYGFYQSLGWDFDSETFMEAGVPHRRMVFRPEPAPVETFLPEDVED